MNATTTTNTTDIRNLAEPELLSLSDAYDRYRLKRGHLNSLIATGRIKSVSLRERGKIRGRRLIFHQSLRDFIFSH